MHLFVDLLPSRCKTGFYSNTLYPLPLRNKDGGRVLLLNVGKKWKTKELPPENYFKTLLLFLDVAMAESKTQVSNNAPPSSLIPNIRNRSG